MNLMVKETKDRYAKIVVIASKRQTKKGGVSGQVVDRAGRLE